MEDKKPTLQESAMRYGTAMGIFWTLKFVLFPMGMENPLLLTLFFFLTLAVPFIGYFLTRKYRNEECGGAITFSRAFMFVIFMYLFATLFVTIAHYIYFRFMDNGYIVSSYESMLSQFDTIATTEEMRASIEQFKEALKMVGDLSPIEISMQLISQNIFYCSLIAIPTAFFVKRKPQTEQP